MGLSKIDYLVTFTEKIKTKPQQAGLRDYAVTSCAILCRKETKSELEKMERRAEKIKNNGMYMNNNKKAIGGKYTIKSNTKMQEINK